MNNRSCCSRMRRTQAGRPLLCALFLAGLVSCPAWAGDAPAWMHAVANAPLPPHDEKSNAVLLYAERHLTVISAEKTRLRVRAVYKILRPDGREYGELGVPFNAHGRVTAMHGWSIPSAGKDYEVKDKEAVEVAAGVENGELVTDMRYKVLRIPAADPGNVIGYEYEVEEQPLLLEDTWDFQTHTPVRESHYALEIPAGWEFKALWVNHAEVKPVQGGNGEQQWTVSEVNGIRHEQDMPPLEGVAGQMVILFYPPGGPSARGFANWQQMGNWYLNLTSGRQEASPEIKQEVSTLTASRGKQLDKMRAIAEFVQRDIRYVAIELGIGGYQPHPAADTFAHRYGDCKDKATLMASMLHEIGVESYYVVINNRRGAVNADSPAGVAFNHVVLAIHLPDDIHDALLMATLQHPALGRLLFFDPTNQLTPFGEISGQLQANYGLLVAPGGGQLVQLPMQPPAFNSIQRTGAFTLDSAGNLQGNVQEMRLGDRAAAERWALRTVTTDTDRIKPIENVLAGSLPSFQITKASVLNAQLTDQPFGFNYSFQTDNYAKTAADLLLVRPRVLGTKAEAFLESKESRQFPIEFPGPVHDTDQFDITVPSGYAVDELPPAVDVDYSFASYHSKTQVVGHAIRYTRVFEIKELTVPVSKADDLKKFYRFIATDERNTAVLKASN